jgi:hypothetical protein
MSPKINREADKNPLFRFGNFGIYVFIRLRRRPRALPVGLHKDVKRLACLPAGRRYAHSGVELKKEVVNHDYGSSP